MTFFGPLAVAKDIPYPRLKPAAPKLSNILSESDARIFRASLTAAERRQWSIVAANRQKLSDHTAKNVLFWLEAQKNPYADFSTLTHVVQTLHDWPRMVAIQANAEDKMFDKPIGAQKTIGWFLGKEPISGEGRAALAKAYYDSGNSSAGDEWLRKAWRDAKLTRDGQKKIFSKYKDRLTAEDHYARADHLVWQGYRHFTKAQALMPFMTAGDKALIDSRIRLNRNASGMDAAINRIPESQKADPGFLYERGRWRRRKRTKTYALPVYLEINSAPQNENGKKKLWRERKIMTYWSIEEKKWNDAYKLTLNHGMERGAGFAEAEFLGGWLALTKLGQVDLAITHFERLKNGVSFPVSVARANYWLGRAYERKNDPQSQIYYAEAARFSNTYYGFLAGEKLGTGYQFIALPNETVPESVKLEYESDERVKAMRLFGEVRDQRLYTQFSFHLDDELDSLEKLSLLSQTGKDYGYMRPSVRAAKQASRFGAMLTESGYPMPAAILDLPDKFDKAFVLAIARQESEFENNAVSHARAYGLMQMINSTARATARQHRIPYSRSRLTTDIDYSAKLGALHLHDLLRQYDGSYILAAVGYNAGPHRVKQWIRTYGDPRTNAIDPIDWLESIPFSETRNYVQRVMENIQVYRARMNGNTAENRVYHDLTVGAF